MPRLSVLMPAYNAADTIGTALSSTLRDLPRDAEVVVLDDGSTDATADVVDRVRDPRVRLYSRENAGVAASLNELLEMTDSEFVARMDADDIVLPGRFHRQLRALGRRSSPDGCDAVFTTVVTWGARAPAPPRPSSIDPDAFGLHLLLTNPVAHPTLLARRASITAVGGYRLIPTEDYDLWLRLAAAGARIRRIPLPGLAYRVHPRQVTASAGWRRSSWANPDINDAYAALAEALTGSPSPRITTLSIDDTLTTDQKRERFEEFTIGFERAILGQAAPAQRALRRKLAERRVWLERQLAREAGTRSAEPAPTSRPRLVCSHTADSPPAATAVSPTAPPLTPQERYRTAIAADRAANAAYPKSRLVLRWFRAAQRWRATPGPLARALFLVIGGSYKAITEGVLGIELPVSTSVGPGLRLRHGFGIVINPASQIGTNVMLRHAVTIGNRTRRGDCPIIGDNVEIGVGAVIIGAITIGHGARIGPNAVVVADVPAGGVVYSPTSSVDLR